MSDDILFDKTKSNGDPITCKFCRTPVWVHRIKNRIHDVGGASLHVENCPNRKAFYKNRALDAAEERRHK